MIGASRGIGWGIAQSFAKAGAHVVLNGRDERSLEARKEALADAGIAADTAAFDATDQEISRSTIRDLHALDILVISAATVMRAPTLEFSDRDWDKMMIDNLRMPFVLAQAALRRMVHQEFGRVIIISSIFDRMARPQVAAYVTVKGGLSALTRALAVEFGSDGVTVNAIAPGYVRTDATQTLYDNPEFRARITDRTPAGRWAEPKDIGGAAVFLASDLAAYVNGTVLVVDGGLSASL